MLVDDLRIAAQVGEVHACVHGQARHVEIEVIRNRAHHGIAFAHQPAHRVLVTYVDGRGQKAATRVGGEEMGKMADLQIRKSYLLDLLVLQ